MQFKRIATVAGTIAAATLLTDTPALALAFEDEIATATTTASDGPWYCENSVGAEVCFTHDGDWIFVRDMKADGKSALMSWQVQDGNNVIRWGYTWNTSGAGEYRYKNKDFPEGKVIQFWACQNDYSKGEPDESCSPGRKVTT